MSSSHKQINSRVTDEEHEALLKLMDLLGKNKAETIRHCVLKVCAEHGIEVSDTMTEQGKWDRSDS